MPGSAQASTIPAPKGQSLPTTRPTRPTHQRRRLHIRSKPLGFGRPILVTPPAYKTGEFQTKHTSGAGSLGDQTCVRWS